MARRQKNEKWSLKKNAEYGDFLIQRWPASERRPAQPDARLWRFMDLSKFAWLVFERRLYMPNLRLLRQSDPFEGTIPIAAIEKHLAPLRRHVKQTGAIFDSNVWNKLATHRVNVGFAEAFSNLAYVSCWYLSDHASDAMWGLYGGANNSVAIRTTLSRLEDSLPKHVMAGRVEYIDFSSNDLEQDLVTRVFQKRKDFEHEKELRALAIPTSASLADMRPFANRYGYAPPVDTNELIVDVVVNPLADDWFKLVVEKILAAGGCGAPVSRTMIVPITQLPDQEFRAAAMASNRDARKRLRKTRK